MAIFRIPETGSAGHGRRLCPRARLLVEPAPSSGQSRSQRHAGHLSAHLPSAARHGPCLLRGPVRRDRSPVVSSVFFTLFREGDCGPRPGSIALSGAALAPCSFEIPQATSSGRPRLDLEPAHVPGLWDLPPDPFWSDLLLSPGIVMFAAKPGAYARLVPDPSERDVTNPRPCLAPSSRPRPCWRPTGRDELAGANWSESGFERDTG